MLRRVQAKSSRYITPCFFSASITVALYYQCLSSLLRGKMKLCTPLTGLQRKKIKKSDKYSDGHYEMGMLQKSVLVTLIACKDSCGTGTT